MKLENIVTKAERHVIAMAGRAVAERNVPAFEALEAAVKNLSDVLGGPNIIKH